MLETFCLGLCQILLRTGWNEVSTLVVGKADPHDLLLLLQPFVSECKLLRVDVLTINYLFYLSFDKLVLLSKHQK